MRECGACQLCCKVLKVEEVQKPLGHWCLHATKGRQAGCRIYETRPDVCRTYQCFWLQGWGTEEMRPDKLHAVLSGVTGGHLVIHEDAGHPGYGRRVLRPVAEKAVAGKIRMFLYCGTEKFEYKEGSWHSQSSTS